MVETSNYFFSRWLVESTITVNWEGGQQKNPTTLKLRVNFEKFEIKALPCNEAVLDWEVSQSDILKILSVSDDASLQLQEYQETYQWFVLDETSLRLKEESIDAFMKQCQQRKAFNFEFVKDGAIYSATESPRQIQIPTSYSTQEDKKAEYSTSNNQAANNYDNKTNVTTGLVGEIKAEKQSSTVRLADAE